MHRPHLRTASALVVAMAFTSNAFVTQHSSSSSQTVTKSNSALHLQLPSLSKESQQMPDMGKIISTFAASAVLAASLAVGAPAFAENELSDIYGGKGFDSSLVDQTCLVDRCSNQAKACLADDPSCRKGLTCTAKCLGDNSCITGCMARYGNKNLDNLLKCTIEDHECIKIAILDGGADKYGQEPRSPAPTIRNFDYKSMEGTWFKVVGFNPNYDCYACQRNTFAIPQEQDGYLPVSRLNMGVEFSMPHLMPDGSPLPPKNVRESILVKNDAMTGMKSVGLNDYSTNEVMIFDKATDSSKKLVMNEGKANEASFSRTAHSEGEMFGLKFWENWYVIGENDPGTPEFKFIYYNGKTRQNTYEGAFVYSRARELEPESMKKVYGIAKEAGMNPDQFCSIRNGCFGNEGASPAFQQQQRDEPDSIPFRGIMASTKVSELLGVEAVSATDYIDSPDKAVTQALQPKPTTASRPWWYEVGDYLENPRRHFDYMDSLRQNVAWPEEVRSQE